MNPRLLTLAGTLCLAFALPALSQEEIFTDIAESSGLDFTHFNGMSGEYYFPEMTGQGGALIDFDNDGDLDVFLIQGNMLGKGKTMKDALFPTTVKQPRDRLYRNDLTVNTDGSRSLVFVDITDSTGIMGTDYGMGVTVGDYDNDGYPDLYVTNYGPNRLWRNNGDGTFSDKTAEAGVADTLWGTSAAFLDYDRDGHLDLYVANYVEFDLDRNPACYGNSSRRDYCGPAAYTSQGDRLFHNLGNGRFRDVTTTALKNYKPGPGLGVSVADLDGNGWVDLYIANDGKPNQLWLNQGDGTFIDDALFTGTAVNRAGRAEASMGVDAADFDNDGDPDLFMTHLMGETNTLYVNMGDGLFDDKTIEYGLASSSMPFTAFGTAWFDYDNDGWLDLLILNGAVQVIESLAAQGDKHPLEQPNQLFHNSKGNSFRQTTQEAGEALKLLEVSRGAAFGDLDNDGDTDVVIFNNNGHVRLLQNNIGQNQQWIGLRLEGETGHTQPAARAALKFRDGETIWRRVRIDGSYCSANDPRILFGLGERQDVSSVEITWPDGLRESWTTLKTGHYNPLIKGKGRRLD